MSDICLFPPSCQMMLDSSDLSASLHLCLLPGEEVTMRVSSLVHNWLYFDFSFSLNLLMALLHLIISEILVLHKQKRASKVTQPTSVPRSRGKLLYSEWLLLPDSCLSMHLLCVFTVCIVLVIFLDFIVRHFGHLWVVVNGLYK